MEHKRLYIEINSSTREPLSTDAQENYCGQCATELVEATPEQIEEAKKYYAEHKKCKHHLVYDEHLLYYDRRTCGICNTLLGLI